MNWGKQEISGLCSCKTYYIHTTDFDLLLALLTDVFTNRYQSCFQDNYLANGTQTMKQGNERALRGILLDDVIYSFSVSSVSLNTDKIKIIPFVYNI